MEVVLEIFEPSMSLFRPSVYIPNFALKKCEKAYDHWIVFMPGVLRVKMCVVLGQFSQPVGMAF